MSRNRSLDNQKLLAIQSEIAELEYQQTTIRTTSEYAAIERKLKIKRQEEGRLKGLLGY